MKEIKITSNGIKQAIDDLVNENEILQDKVYKLEERLQQKENIIKEVREYIMTELISEYDIEYGGCVSGSDLPVDAITPILEILDKEDKE